MSTRSRSLASQRQQQILELVGQQGAARVGELALALAVSEMTVRRDLEHLDTIGLITKVHGGATARRERSAIEPEFSAKSQRNMREKQAIADACTDLVSPGSAIGLTGGTTTAEVARRLTRVADLTVVTNSLSVADIFHTSSAASESVVLTGGVRTPSNALVGPVAVETLRSFHLDLVIMGVHGMFESSGFSTPNLLEAETNKSFISATTRLIVVADHTKWGVAGLTSMLPLDAADVLITDEGMPTDVRTKLGKSIKKLIVARHQRR